MQTPSPHFVLYSEATIAGANGPRWKFVRQSLSGDDRFSAADTELETRASRLELLAVVRGLESLCQPSRVTLLTRSRYVSRGIRRELNHWRERRWRWERFGKLVPIRDHDLWQRIDRALQFHRVECCAWTHDEARASAPGAESTSPKNPLARLLRRRRSGTIAAALGRLRQGVLAPISAIWPPPFTRAA